MKTFIFAIVLGLAAASCAANQTTSQNSTAKGVPFQSLIPLNSTDPKFFRLNRPDILATTFSDEEDAIEAMCSEEVHQVDSVALVFFGSFIKGGINLLLDLIDKKLEKELAKHSASYSASLWLDDTNISNLKCFRFVRGVSNKDGDTIHLDMIIAVYASQDTLGSRVFPLRLYYGKPAPSRPSSNDKYGLAVSMTTTNITEHGQTTSPETLLLKDSFTLKKDDPPVVRYYDGFSGKYCKTDALRNNHQLSCSDGSRGQYVAITQLANSPVFPVGVTVSAAETGTPDKHLNALSKLFSKSKKDIGAGLGDLAVAKLGLGPD